MITHKSTDQGTAHENKAGDKQEYFKKTEFFINESRFLQAQSTYICKVKSCVWRLPKYRPPPPSPSSECVLPMHKRRGDTHSPGGEGVRGQYFGRRQTLDWPLTVKSLYVYWFPNPDMYIACIQPDKKAKSNINCEKTKQIRRCLAATQVLRMVRSLGGKSRC